MQGTPYNISQKIPIYKEAEKMAKNEKTSKRVGSIASKLLKSKKTTKKTKSVAGSALTQRPDKKKKK